MCFMQHKLICLDTIWLDEINFSSECYSKGKYSEKNLFHLNKHFPYQTIDSDKMLVETFKYLVQSIKFLLNHPNFPETTFNKNFV